MTAGSETVLDPFDPRLATGAPAVLEPFNRAGVLGPAEVHGAATLTRLVGGDDDDVLLAVALALRAPSHGHVCLDLTHVRDQVTGHREAPVDVDGLRWPDPERWRARIAASPLVAERPAGERAPPAPEDERPLVLVDDRLYLDRYWRYETRVATILARRARRVDTDRSAAEVRAALDRLFPRPADEPAAGPRGPDRQRLAVAAGALRHLTVLAGGPGTGKTHTVARLLALEIELALAGGHRPRIAVTAPTGKAADRLVAALRGAAAELDTTAEVRAHLRALDATTIHRLLGWRHGGTRFRHDRHHKLPHDLVVVDETSMVSVALMAKLLVALAPRTRLVLVGDPDQLASVEAGVVLGDIVGPVRGQPSLTIGTVELLAAATGEPLDTLAPEPRGEPAAAPAIADAVITLTHTRRFRAASGIADLATAIHAGRTDAVLRVLADADDVTWIEADPDAPGEAAGVEAVREAVVAASRGVVAAARRGDAGAALAAITSVRILCAHRRGPAGVAAWVDLVETWLAAAIEEFHADAPWYVGRPVLVTRNDERLRLFNGDVGVTVTRRDGVGVAFPGPDGPRILAPSRLEEVETVHAMTIHKSQGSQFDHVVVVLPEPQSRILTRELLYTAATRARERVTVIGPEASIRTAIDRRVARASGLRAALWGADAPR